MKLVNKVVNKVDPVCPIIKISSSFPSIDCLLANEAAAMYDCSRKAKGVESTEHLVQPGTTEQFEDQSEKKTQQRSPTCMHLGRDSRWMSFWIWTYFSILREALPWYSASCLDRSNSSFNFFQKMIFIYIYTYIYILYSLSKCSQQISFLSYSLFLGQRTWRLREGPCRVGAGGTQSNPTAFGWYRAQLEDLSSEGWSISTTQGALEKGNQVMLLKSQTFFGQLFFEWFLVGVNIFEM